jgi:uncharacterized membrane protein YdjX (TVP38/TMEM64 family)
VFLLAAFAVSYHLDLAGRFDVDAIRELVQGAGLWGVLLYVAAFAAGEFLHVPGLVFVAAGILVYGKASGFFVVLLGAVTSVCFSFLVVRRIGGTPLREARNPWLRRMLAGLERHPLRTVFVLRTLLWMAPPLNYALALTPVRFSHYALGSTLGLILPVAGATLLIEWLLALL